MHDSIADLTRPLTLDELVADTERRAFDGATEIGGQLRAARATSLSDAPVERQREVLTSRIGSDAVAALEREGPAAIDPMQGRRIVSLPGRDVVGADRSVIRGTRARRDDGTRGAELAPGTVDIGTGELMPGDEIMAREDARRGWAGAGADPDEIAGGKYDGVEQAAANKDRYGRSRKAQGAGSGDKGPKARPAVGPTTDELHERLIRGDARGAGGRPRKGRDVRQRFSVRAEASTRATIATTGHTESDFIAEAAKLVAMAQTGAQADELMRAVIALAGEAAADVAA